MKIPSIAAVAVVSVLSACGGGNGGTGGAAGGGAGGMLLPAFPGVGSSPFSLAEITSYANFPTIDLTTLAPGVPGGATATYDGIVELNESTGSSSRDYVGRMTLNADFSSGAISSGTIGGTSSNFIEVAGVLTSTPSIVQTVGGAVSLSNGVINSSGFKADFNGSLTIGSQTRPVVTTVDGQFGTLNGQNLAVGLVTGTIGANSLNGLMTGNER